MSHNYESNDSQRQAIFSGTEWAPEKEQTGDDRENESTMTRQADFGSVGRFLEQWGQHGKVGWEVGR